MISSLTLIHAHSGLEQTQTPQLFTLKTCQRTIFLGLSEISESSVPQSHRVESFQGIEAYQFLLETICGLKSRVLGENEIVHQFKEAYRDYLKNSPNYQLVNILEKLFKDAKGIRHQYMQEIGSQTYAGIARKIATSRFDKGPLVIMGSGHLSEDLIKILKRKYDLLIYARNQERSQQLTELYDIKALPWGELQYLSQYPLLINTIGSSQVIFSKDFLKMWAQENTQNRLLIDLARPSSVALSQDSSVMGLESVFKEAERQSQDKGHKLKKVEEVIVQVSQNRKSSFSLQFPHGWEELHFA